MVSSCPTSVLVLALAIFAFLAVCEGEGEALKYHGGPVLSGQLNIAILWYGSFAHVQKNTVGTFIKSLNHNLGVNTHPQASEWWRAVEGYAKGSPRIGIEVVKQMTEAEYPHGKVLTYDFVEPLVQKVASGSPPNTIAVIVADRQVSVHGLCSGKCYLRGVVAQGNIPYIVIGNPETECPEACAWPFQPSAPDGLTLKPPSGNVGADSMVVNLASGLAAVVTNPFNNGWFDGPSVEPIEAATACPNMFGSGALPGQPGKLLNDPASGAAFNAIGTNDRKFLLPAIWTPMTSNCWALL